MGHSVGTEIYVFLFQVLGGPASRVWCWVGQPVAEQKIIFVPLDIFVSEEQKSDSVSRLALVSVAGKQVSWNRNLFLFRCWVGQPVAEQKFTFVPIDIFVTSGTEI
jgi:hypothetical protein